MKMNKITLICLALLMMPFLAMAERENEDNRRSERRYKKRVNKKRYRDNNTDQSNDERKFRRHKKYRNGKFSKMNRKDKAKFVRGFIAKNFTHEEKRELKKLYRNNPEKFRKVIGKKLKAFRKAREEKRIERRSLVKKYHRAKSTSERKRIRATIHSKVKKEYIQRMKNNRQRLAEAEERYNEMKKRMKARLDALRTRYKKLKKESNDIVESRVNSLLGESKGD